MLETVEFATSRIQAQGCPQVNALDAPGCVARRNLEQQSGNLEEKRRPGHPQLCVLVCPELKLGHQT
jgi:hypothetical protein